MHAIGGLNLILSKKNHYASQQFPLKIYISLGELVGGVAKNLFVNSCFVQDVFHNSTQ
jgi:hypothetical protein